MTRRLALALTGALAGAVAWGLTDLLPGAMQDGPLAGVLGDRLLFLLDCLAAGFFGVLLVATGPLPVRRALAAAAVVAVPSAGLVFWASYRHDTVQGFFDTWNPLAAYVGMVLVGTPFALVLLRGEGRWNDYGALFSHAWLIVVRHASAVLFTALFWGLIWVSDALLGLVGLKIIGQILEYPLAIWLITGTILGLALAVVNELSDYVSPFIILRLLRLMLPFLLVVTAVFLLAIPFRGLGGLFGALSPGATLLGVALAAATLVTSALDQRNDLAVHGHLMRNATRLLALLLPFLTGLALYAVWLRVEQYGWSPNRFAAFLAAAILTGHGLGYSAAILARHHWMDRVRQVNIYMALATLALAALWLTPALDAERLSAGNQVARYLAGRTDVEVLDMHEMATRWGRAGQSALARLEAADAPHKDRLAQRLSLLAMAAQDGAPPAANEDDLAALVARIPVLPAGATLPKGAFTLSDDLAGIFEACARKTAAGNDGCLAVVADFRPELAGNEIIFFTVGPGNWVQAEARAVLDAGSVMRMPIASLGAAEIDSGVIDRLIRGEFNIAPPAVNALISGPLVLTPGK